jgi:hypothetical protein
MQKPLKHLIKPHADSDGPVHAGAYMSDLRSAHDWIVERARGWTADVAEPPDSSWGIRSKRIPVDLTGTDAPPLVTSNQHPISELLNICATVERLLDALVWAIENGWADRVLECNPSTSGASGPPDLRTEGRNGEAWFEVSDVVSPRDPNRKLRTDWDRLAVVGPGIARFLVVSPSFENKKLIRDLAFVKIPPANTIVARVP